MPVEGEIEGDTLRLVTFPLGDECYGVDINLVQEVQPLTEQTWSGVPCTPEFIAGVVNIRGHIYSVIDIARFLGLARRPLPETSHVLLVRGGDQRAEGELELCILTDDMPQVVNIGLRIVRPASKSTAGQAHEYVRGVTDDMLIILDLERLLSDPNIIIHEDV